VQTSSSVYGQRSRDEQLTSILVFCAGFARLPFSLWIKDGKQEHPIMQTIVFDLSSAGSVGRTYTVVKLGNSGWVKLFLLDSYPIFKDFLPSFLEQPRTISTTPSLMRDFLHIPIFIVSPHDTPKFGQLLNDILSVSDVGQGLHTATTSTGSFLNDLGQARSGLFSLSPGLRRILSFFFASVIFSFPALLSSSRSRRWMR
jgi:hypothetical protein